MLPFQNTKKKYDSTVAVNLKRNRDSDKLSHDRTLQIIAN